MRNAQIPVYCMVRPDAVPCTPTQLEFMCYNRTVSFYSIGRRPSLAIVSLTGTGNQKKFLGMTEPDIFPLMAAGAAGLV